MRLNTIETTESNRKEAGLSTQAWFGIGSAVVLSVVGFFVQIYLAVKGD